VLEKINANKAVGWDLINPKSFKELYTTNSINTRTRRETVSR
jgi:hypothetical protein